MRVGAHARIVVRRARAARSYPRGVARPDAVLERAVERLRPLYRDAARSWWEANVAATEENERRRVEALERDDRRRLLHDRIAAQQDGSHDVDDD